MEEPKGTGALIKMMMTKFYRSSGLWVNLCQDSIGISQFVGKIFKSINLYLYIKQNKTT